MSPLPPPKPSEPNPSGLKDLILRILDDNRTMTVATLRADGWPQATTVGFVHDDLTLYFCVARGSQKLANISRDSRTSIAIGHHGTDEASVRGLSMAAHVDEVTDVDDIARLNALIWRLYPEIAVFAPRDANAAVLRARPHLVSVVDDGVGLNIPVLFEVSAHSDLRRVGTTG
jgi:uncharacterized pyridoxamine 5'-phosphate oxidase family protein